MPLGARITGSDWRDGGLTPDDAVAIAKALKGEGIDFVCVSSGGVTADTRNPTEPGYNVPIAARVRKEAGIPTRTVGLIINAASRPRRSSPKGKADMVSMARAFLDDPHWGWHAAKALGADVPRPPQYARVGPEAVGAGGGARRDRVVENFVFLAVLFAALCHAGWNALIKVGLDPLSTTTLISLGAGAGRARAVCRSSALPAAAAWPCLVASVVIHLFYFAGADRGLSHRRSRPGLSDRARLGAADDGGRQHSSSSASS